MRRSISALALLCSVAIACACSSDEDGAGGGNSTGAGGTTSSGSGGTTSSGGEGPGGSGGAGGAGTGGVGGSGGAAGLPYLYVLVQDHTTAAEPGMDGLDVDAIEVVRGGQSYAATELLECAFGTGDNAEANDCNQALGAAGGNCSAQPAEHVSLGGDGGYLLLGFSNLGAIEAGDHVIVHECDATDDGPYDVFVGVGATVSDPNWVVCAQTATGTTDCVVPTLPVVPD